MPLNDDIFETLELRWGICKPYDDILAKVDYIEQTDAGLKVHCHKVEKEKKMNKNEELKDVNCICVFKDGDEVKAVAMRDVNNVLLEGANLFTDYHGSKSKVVASASAKCNPDDIFDFNIGAKLALDRLYEDYNMIPKPKRKPYNGLIYIHRYPGTGLADNAVYRVVDGKIKGCWYHSSPKSDPYIFSDMTDDQLSRKLQIEVYGSDDPSAKVIAYFIHNDKT